MDSPEGDDDNKSLLDLSDDDTINEGSPIEDDLEFKEKPIFQKEIHFNKLLPYAKQSQEEADLLLAKIKANLGRCVMLRKINNGCEFWIDMLHRYIKIYDMRFTKEDHIAFIKLVYELITIPNLESPLVIYYGYTLITLLRKSDLISPEELELPWRPVYQMCRNTIFKKPWHIYLCRHATSLKTMFESLVYTMKIYFPVSATQEILDELRPQISPFNNYTMHVISKIFEWFLPIQLVPKYHSQGYKLWFDEFMFLWKNCTHYITSSSLMHLLSELAYQNIGYIDWEPYVPLMFTKFVQTFPLPVNYKNIRCKSNVKFLPSDIGVWIAATLGNKSSTQLYLDKFLKTIETYFHPVNYGTWLKELEDLITNLAKNVIYRLFRERYQTEKPNRPRWKQQIPDSHKLTDADVDAFVNSMLPIVMIGVFNKRCNCYTALNHLATVRPNIVIPAVLEKVYATLGNNIEHYKQIPALHCLISIARPMVQGSHVAEKDYAFQEGPLHVLPLLFASLAGIDTNEQQKCLVTFRMIHAYVSMIPIVDCSKSTLLTGLSEDELLVCEETSRFEDFVLQFMDKVFAYIESSAVESVRLECASSASNSQPQCKAEAELSACFLALLTQSSRAIFLSALGKLRTFIMESSQEIHVSGRLVAILCEVFAYVNGPETLKALLPFLSEKFLEVIGEDDVFKAEHLDSQVLYPLLLMCHLVTQGNVLLPYEDILVKVIDKAIRSKSLESNDLGFRLICNILRSLTHVTPIRLDRNLDDPEYPYIRDWGKTIKVKSAQFYAPGDEEKAVLQRIFERFFLPAVADIETFIETENSLTKQQLQWTLTLIHIMVKGYESFFPVWSEPPLELKPDDEYESYQPVLNVTGEIKMPDGSNVRYFLAELMVKLQEVMLKNVEDDTKSFLALQMVWHNIFFGSVLTDSGFRFLIKYLPVFRATKNKLTACKGWFPTFILAQVYALHCMRKQQAVVTFTATHKKILMNLFTLSISRYPGIRIKSQKILQNVNYFFPDAYTILIPEIVEVLKRDPTTHHEAFKGILYMLIKQPRDDESLLIKRDWEFIRAIWPALASSGNSEKPSIIRLKKSIFDLLSNNFNTFNIKLEVPDTCLSAAENLWKSGTKPSKPPPTAEEIQKGLEILRETGEKNLKIYNSILNSLLNVVLEKNKLWSDRLMTLHLIFALLHNEEVFPTPIVRFFLNSLIHESIKERDLAMRVMTFIFKQFKKKHPKIKIPVPSNANSSIVESSAPNFNKFGSRADNAWLQYNYETRPTSAAAWDEPRYVHKVHVGYYMWPRELEVYAPSSQQPNFEPSSLAEQELEVLRFFSEQRNVDKLVEYLSMEGKRVTERFDENCMIFFKGLFRNYGDVFLPRFLPHLHRLVEAKQRNSAQRCAAEIIAGLVQGSKHWRFEMVEAMWAELLPIIRTALNNLTGETIMLWHNCVSRACMRRDPNRMHWLLECLVEESCLAERQNVTSIVEHGRIIILQGALAPNAWRVVGLLHRVLRSLEVRLEQRLFRTVRDALVTMLNFIFRESREPIPGVSDPEDSLPLNGAQFIDKFYPKLQTLFDDDQPEPSDSQENTATKVDADKPTTTASSSESVNGASVETERDKNLRLFKMMCVWIYCSVKISSLESLSSFYKLLPLMFQLESDEKDEELSKLCSASIAALAHAFHLSHHIPAALEAVRHVSNSTSWSSRANCLEFVQVLVFHNMSFFLSNEAWIHEIREIVLRLLEDERIEVREKAAKLLGGLLHCTILPDPETLLDEFKKKTRIKLGKRKKRVATSEEDVNNTANAINAARLRHASILGLCAFITAYPYDIPKHIPPIFECLSSHLNDPEPIPRTIHKTVNEFKRTHCDGWTGLQGLAEKFTEEQFAVLQDLTVPPSYYA